MISNEVLGFTGAILFVAFVGLCLRTTARWGAETKKREEEYEKAASVDVVDEDGTTLTIVRTPQAETQTPIPKSDGNATVVI